MQIIRIRMMNYKAEYNRWCGHVKDDELRTELETMDEAAIEDAFYRNLAFGTGGLRGILGAGTNRMNIHVVAKASQGLANYLKAGASVVIGYDSRIHSDLFAEVAAGVFAANGITVHIWPELTPVPTVSFATRKLKASAGVMITASHNPSKYNGYKVYGPDGCQITSGAAKSILAEINALDIFADIRTCDFEEGLRKGKIRYIEASVLSSYIEAVKEQSVLFGDKWNQDVAIVYTPLNGTGLLPVCRVLRESGFSNITLVEEQREPDGNFPTCPYPNPEVREAMELGLAYCRRSGADLLLATDPDCDRCGIAVRAPGGEYVFLSGNEVGLLLLEYVCSQRSGHKKMPEHPVFVKTIVTMDLAEKIADHYGVETINVLTGFKYIGEVIGKLEEAGRETDFICSFEESYGYLTGSYVREKDGVNAALMICEMLSYYKSKGISLAEQLDRIYRTYGYCLNTLHSFEFPGSAGMEKMNAVMSSFRRGIESFGSEKVMRSEDYLAGLHGLPKSDVLKFYFEGEGETGSVVVRPSGTEPKLKVYISVTAEEKEAAEKIEKQVMETVNFVLARF